VCDTIKIDTFIKPMLINFQQVKISELESLSGIPAEMWCRWFSGHHSISGKSLEKASRALGVTAPALLEQIERRKAAKLAQSQGSKNFGETP
jgi:hypothetical protein